MQNATAVILKEIFCSCTLSLLHRFVERAQTTLVNQASMSVLDLTMLVSQIKLGSVLKTTQSTPEGVNDQDCEDPPSALCFCLSMAKDAYISAQLLDYSIGAESMPHVTAFMTDLNVGFLLKHPKVQPQGTLYESEHVCSDSSMNDQACSFALSVTFLAIQFDVSAVSTATGQKHSGTQNEILTFDLCCANGECIPLVQLALNELSVTAVGHLNELNVMPKVLTFSDISKENGHVAVVQADAISDVVVSVELKQLQWHIIHTLECYPNIVQHMDTLTKHCSQYVSQAIQSTSELLETLTATHKAILCNLLLSAASQSGRFLPKVSATM